MLEVKGSRSGIGSKNEGIMVMCEGGGVEDSPDTTIVIVACDFDGPSGTKVVGHVALEKQDLHCHITNQ